MASNLGCVGLAVSDEQELRGLIRRALPHAERFGRADGIDLFRWQDSSGARLILGTKDGDVPDLLPSFDATRGARLRDITLLTTEVASASIVDEEGEQMTALAIEFEEQRLLRRELPQGTVEASITALGVDVQTFANADEFGESPASLLSSEDEEHREPPPHYVERGWKWPPRVGSESFISYGVFGAPGQARPHARLAGTVLQSEVRTNQLTGQQFVAARVRTVGFETHVCFPADGRPAPREGSVIHGTVFLVGSVHVAPSRRRAVAGSDADSRSKSFVEFRHAKCDSRFVSRPAYLDVGGKGSP